MELAGSRAATDTSVDRIWDVMDAQVASGRIPWYVSAVRVKGRVTVRTDGRTATEADGA